MYRGFNLPTTGHRPWNSDRFLDIGLELFDQNRRSAEAALLRHLGTNGVVDGTLMQREWFPEIRAQVFLSHSHSDIQEAQKLAGWLLEAMGLVPFIDSAVWGHANTLLQAIDDNFCLDTAKHTYDYQQRNGTTSHVHAMLSAALMTMIDRTECLFFINTPKSLTPRGAAQEAGTYSPWIYLELSTSSIVRRRPPEQHRQLNKEASAEGRRVIAEKRDYVSHYDISSAINALAVLDGDKALDWERAFKQSKQQHPHQISLDVLYSRTLPVR